LNKSLIPSFTGRRTSNVRRAIVFGVGELRYDEAQTRIADNKNDFFDFEQEQEHLQIEE
jgi:hypothetical protein